MRRERKWLCASALKIWRHTLVDVTFDGVTIRKQARQSLVLRATPEGLVQPTKRAFSSLNSSQSCVKVIDTYQLSYKTNVYMELGFLFLGGALSTFTAIITGAITPAQTQNISVYLIIAWAVVAVTLIVGILCIGFAFGKEKSKKKRASEIIEQMEIIEKRFEIDRYK